MVNLKITSQVVTSGAPGPAGKSAYQIAVDNGFEGTESEWLKELHPFKGWFDSVSELEEEHSAPSVGDYAYVKGATSSDPVKIYECSTEGTWSDSGRTVDTSTVQTFRSGEAVNDVDITDDSSDIEENSDKIPTAGAVAGALDNAEFSTGEKVKNVGIDSEPTIGSDSLVKSGGVFDIKKREIKQIQLVHVGPSGAGHISKKGEYYFNTSDNKIKYVISFTDSSHFNTVDLIPELTDVYFYNDNIYKYTSNGLVQINQRFVVDEIPSAITSADNIVKSNGTFILISEHGASLFDANYILRKEVNHSSPEDEPNGTRLRVVFKLLHGVKCSFTSNYPSILNLYSTLSSALSGYSVVKESITGAETWVLNAEGETTQDGYLCLGMRKSDNSIISDNDKTAMLESLTLKIYAKGTLTEIIEKEIKNNREEIQENKEEIQSLNNLFSSTTPITSGQISGRILSISDSINTRITSFAVTSENPIIIGKNLLDRSTFVSRKIINDNGVEVVDGSSSYFSQYIPVSGGKITSSFQIQRVYLYDKNKNFLRRSATLNDTTYSIPADTWWVRIQVYRATEPYPNGIIVYNDENIVYEPFVSYTSAPSTGFFRVYLDNTEDAEASVSGYFKAIIPAVKKYPFWEYTGDVTDDYKCTHLNQYTQSIPTLNKLGYSGFLSTYFNIYLGKKSDGYEVKRYELGLDSGAIVEHSECPLFCYEFIPKNYNKTVLLSAGMNTCEASTYFGLAYFIKALMEHTEDGMLALYNTTKFVVLPVICPTGILKDPLLYRNANDVRVNKNFSYNGSWKYNYDEGGQYPGDYPDSEVETKLLKQWLTKYSGATFYMDCHSDVNGADYQTLYLSACFCGSISTRTKVNSRTDEITQFYRDKGYLTPSQTPGYTFATAGSTYPKHPFAENICNIPSLMHEQYISSTAYGSDGHTNNDDFGIKHYMAIIRWYCLIMCESGFEILV